MKLSTKLFIGGGLVAGTGLTIYGIKKYKKGKKSFVVESMIIETEEDAEAVLDTLKKSAETYDYVTVCDYFDLLGLPTTYVTRGYGWTSKTISKAKVKKVRHGYEIKLPKVEVV
jgi:hypothetical protein